MQLNEAFEKLMDQGCKYLLVDEATMDSSTFTFKCGKSSELIGHPECFGQRRVGPGVFECEFFARLEDE